MPSPRFPVLLVLAGGLLAPAVAFGQEVGCSVSAAGSGVVFVADGAAGGLHRPSGSLAAAVREAGVPMGVERVAWQRGLFRPARNLMNHPRHLEQGAALAARVLAYRQDHPADRIVLVGHSTGVAVVLAAADCLPPGSVDRIVLLSGAVSAGYDLRAALASSREGVDAFYSRRDGILSTFVRVLGTADRKWEPAAGWVGFRSPLDDTLTGMLRQFAWRPADVTLGNFGGHMGPTGKRFVRAAVLPLVAPPPPAVIPVGPSVVAAAQAAPPVLRERGAEPVGR